jgi:hypothetical protein
LSGLLRPGIAGSNTAADHIEVTEPAGSSVSGLSCTTPSTSCSQAVAGFVARYNSSWLIQQHRHQTPKEAYQPAQTTAAA